MTRTVQEIINDISVNKKKVAEDEDLLEQTIATALHKQLSQCRVSAYEHHLHIEYGGSVVAQDLHTLKTLFPGKSIVIRPRDEFCILIEIKLV